MTFVVLFVLAVVWAIYLASWLRHRGERRNVNSISSFSQHLSTLERTSPARYGLAAVPQRLARSAGRAPSMVVHSASMTVSQARRRRRDVLLALVGVALVTLVLAVVVGGPLPLALQVLADVALVGYLGLLVRAQLLVQERRTKVRYLHPMATPRPVQAEPYLVGSSASGS